MTKDERIAAMVLQGKLDAVRQVYEQSIRHRYQGSRLDQTASSPHSEQ